MKGSESCERNPSTRPFGGPQCEGVVREIELIIFPRRNIGMKGVKIPCAVPVPFFRRKVEGTP
jgi:hypothetical protein